MSYFFLDSLCSSCVSATLCSADQFQCRDGGCITNSSKCNQKVDCEDASDEMNCSTFGNNQNTFVEKKPTLAPRPSQSGKVVLLSSVKLPRTVPVTSAWG